MSALTLMVIMRTLTLLMMTTTSARAAQPGRQVYIMRTLTLLMMTTTSARAAQPGRQVYSLDKGWRFMRQDDADSSRPGGACVDSWCRVQTDDSGWREVSIPHDFVLEGNFTPSASMSHGYLPFGVGVYRKRVTLPKAALEVLKAGSHKASLLFDGVQSEATVFVGGVGVAATHSSGYTPFKFYLSPAQVDALIKGGNGALIAVRADARTPDGWWYDGGGIYRHVKLVLLPKTHLAHDGGVYLPTKVIGKIDTVSSTATSQLDPRVTVASFAADAVAFSISADVMDEASGAVVGHSSATGVINPCHQCRSTAVTVTTALPPIVISSARLWSPGSPTLYRVTVGLHTNSSLHANGSFHTNGSMSDSSSYTIGFRSAVWKPSSGLWLNDVPTKIVGAANHQDFAGVGVAVPDALQAHRVAKLKEMGVNGWRTAHNAPTPALLDAADRLGMLVWDENHRNGQEDELRRLVQRDFNHPVALVILPPSPSLPRLSLTAQQFSSSLSRSPASLTDRAACLSSVHHHLVNLLRDPLSFG